jgi:hypothetical protein
MASSIYSLFQVDINNLVQNKIHLCRKWRIQPSEIEEMPYWEWEMWMEEINKTLKEEEKRREEQEKQSGASKNDYGKTFRDFQSRQSRLMNTSNFRPSFTPPSMPKI